MAHGSTKKARDRRSRGLSLRTTILTMIISIIGLLSTVLIVTAWHYASTNAKALSGRLMSQIASGVVTRVAQYMKPADTGAALTRLLTRSRVIETRDTEKIERFFIHLLQVYPQLAMVNYGDEQGNFLMVKRFPVDTRCRGFPLGQAGVVAGSVGVRGSGQTAPTGPRKAALANIWQPGARLGPRPERFTVPRGSLSTKIVQRTGGQPLEIWKYRDLEDRVRSVSVSTTIEYDPRERPWYAQARKTRTQGWTGAYIFFTDRKPGVASVSPVLEGGAFRGAVSVEIELFRISEFLKASRLGPRSTVFLINEKKEVLAYSDTAKFRKRVSVRGEPRWVLRQISEIPDGEVVSSFRALSRRASALPPAGQQIFSFDHGGEAWQAMYLPLPARAGLQWTVGIVVPDDAFLGQIKRNRWMAVIISLLVSLTAVLFAIFLSRSISEPLGKLVRETDRIRELDLRGEITVRSNLQEVDQMAAAVESMKAGLRSFEKYVPRELVRQLILSGEEAKVEGERRVMTILFTDIEGFTPIAEGLSPEKLVSTLNRYFDEATNVLLAAGATIDKYIGDAIMAFWGAPKEMERHAETACRAALDLQLALDQLNAAWEADGLPVMRTRIGLHTGEVIVGNIGSDERLAYTIIGDSVNLASRIESINKQYSTWILTSEETYRLVSHAFVGRAVDVVAVKGRHLGVLLYELRCQRGGDDAELLEREARIERGCEEAIGRYRSRRWDAAIESWRAVLPLLGGGDQAIELMIARCELYRREPPPDDWNGVHIAAKK